MKLTHWRQLCVIYQIMAFPVLSLQGVSFHLKPHLLHWLHSPTIWKPTSPPSWSWEYPKHLGNDRHLKHLCQIKKNMYWLHIMWCQSWMFFSSKITLPSVLHWAAACGCWSGDSRLSRRFRRPSNTPLLLRDLWPMQDRSINTLGGGKIKVNELS